MFACIFIPDFPVEAIVRFEPELRARCVAHSAVGLPWKRWLLGMKRRDSPAWRSEPHARNWRRGKSWYCARARRRRRTPPARPRLCAVVFSGDRRHGAEYCAAESRRTGALVWSRVENRPRLGPPDFEDGVGGEHRRCFESGCCPAGRPWFFRRDLDCRRTRSGTSGRLAGGCVAGKFCVRC